MKKHRMLTTALAGILGLLSITGCTPNSSTNKGNISGTNTGRPTNTAVEEKINYVGEVRVYSAAEYIDLTVLKDFEKEYKIKVEYEEFESNEQMYDYIVKNPNSYDVLVPSDYMIDRLIKENRLDKLNKENITNLSNVSPSYLNPEYDPNNDYVVPYMVGTLGILYNKTKVSEPITSWDALWDSKYRNEIWMWDSMRDVIGASLKRLGYSMNSVEQSELQEAQDALILQKNLVKEYAEEKSRDAMIADEGILALVYSGEAKAAVDQNPNLVYVIPEEGSNKWVDGFVIMKNAKNKEAAEKYINFMCRSNIAIRNMTATGYTSPITGAWSEFGDNYIMFPTDEELNRCEAFLYNAEGTKKYNEMWSKLGR